MWLKIIQLLLPFAVEIIKKYVANSDSKKDDLVLQVVKDTAEYMSKKDNNTLNTFTADVIKSSKMNREV